MKEQPSLPETIKALFISEQTILDKTEKQVKLLAVTMGIVSLYQWFSEYDLVFYTLSHILLSPDLSIIEYLLPLFTLPVAVILFWKGQKKGWILMTIYVTYMSCVNGTVLLFQIGQPYNGEFGSGFFAPPSLATLIFVIVFYGVIDWLLAKKEIKDYFQISKGLFKKTFYITLVVTVLLISRFDYL